MLEYLFSVCVFVFGRCLLPVPETYTYSMDRCRGREAEKQSRIKVIIFVSHEGVYGSGVIAPFFLQSNTT